MSTDNIMKFCPYCGSKVIPNAKFCIECGNDLNILNINNTENISKNEKQKNEITFELIPPNKSERIFNNSNRITEENDIITDNKVDVNTTTKLTKEQPKKSFSMLNKSKKNNKEEKTFDLIRPNPTNNIKQELQPNENKQQYPKKENDIVTNYNSNGLACPSCGNKMHTSETSGFLSKATYNECPKCLLKFKVKDNYLTLEEEPEFSRMGSKLHLKRYTLNQWNEILHGNFTPDFTEDFSKWKFDSSTSFSCPACKHILAKYKSSGFGSKFYLICSGCGLTLEEHKNNLYLLYDCKESFSPLWKYEKNLLTLADMKNIISKEDTEDTKLFRERIVKETERKVKEHENKIKQQQKDLALFNQGIESGNPILPKPSDTTIVLKKNEVPVYKMYNITLSEPRAVRTSSGGYGGTSVRIAKGVTIHTGKTASRSESHDEIKVIDSGELLITNQRVIFLGSNRTTNIDLKKIISITSGPSMIQIQRSNKQKPEYFNNINSTIDFQVEGRHYDITIDGEMIKKIIMGLI